MSEPLRSDDPTIVDTDGLWRRLPPLPAWFHRNPGGRVRRSSMAFLDNINKELSVHLASLTTPDRILTAYPGVSLAETVAGVPRSLGHAVLRDPTPDDASHALVCPPMNQSPSQRKRDARRMAEAARWVVLQAIE